MLDKVTIAYRGATYEIGRGRDYFGLWTTDAPRSQPMEWWPETQEGWSAAWARFTALEAPDTITPAGRDAAGAAEHGAVGERFAPAAEAGHGGRRGLVAALLLGLGVALGIAGLFPDYVNGTSVAGQADNLVAHAIYLAVWAASAVLIALGGTRLRIGALLATGQSIVTFGFFLADAGTPIAGAHTWPGRAWCSASSAGSPAPRAPRWPFGSRPPAAPPEPGPEPGRPGAGSRWAGRAAPPSGPPCCSSWPGSAPPPRLPAWGQLHPAGGDRADADADGGQRLRRAGCGHRRERGRDGGTGRGGHRRRLVAPRPPRRRAPGREPSSRWRPRPSPRSSRSASRCRRRSSASPRTGLPARADGQRRRHRRSGSTACSW